MSTQLDSDRLRMEVSLGTIDDLGVKLYSGFPAALAELVANAWDADAEQVDISTSKDEIIIKDDGHGMNRDDIQKKYLTVGYRRRDEGEKETPKYSRPVMGRKGIGRLALFSIAKDIKVYSVKNGEKIGLKLSYPEIRKAIKAGGYYYPEELLAEEIDFNKGTKIELTDFQHQSRGLEKYLKQRLSRRFSIIGEEYHFKVFVNEEEISADDRNYYSKIQELWTFGDKKGAEDIKKACNKHEYYDHLNNNNGELSGWIGAVSERKQLKESDDNLNNIVIMMRGRLAQEDILHSLDKGEIAEKYLIGEIHADYLDKDDEEDIATSGRQNLNKNDERYSEIKNNVKRIVTKVCNEWEKRHSKKALNNALKREPIKKWFNKLSPDAKSMARKLFSATYKIEDDDRKETLISCIVPAVERMNVIGNLAALEDVSIEDIEKFSSLFADHNAIEAMLYYQITEGRLHVIDKLSKHVENNTLEQVVQKHIYDNPWLLDPSWDRACGDTEIEKEIEKEIENAWKKIKGESKKVRIDIKYKKTSGQHVIIELKRPSAPPNQIRINKLTDQIEKYMVSAKKVLEKHGKPNADMKGIILLGEFPPEFETYPESMKQKKIEGLQTQNIYLMTYGEVIVQAQNQYQKYLDKQKKVGEINETIKEIFQSTTPNTDA